MEVTNLNDTYIQNLFEIEERDQDKFIQYYIDDQPFLYFTNGDSHFSGLNGIRYRLRKELSENDWNTDGNTVNRDDTSKRGRVVGMGFARFYLDDRVVRLWGHSSTFRLHPNKEHMERIDEYIQDWKLKG